jgi:hypothetical protein
MKKKFNIGKLIKIITIIITIPFYCFVSILPFMVFLHTTFPYVGLIGRIHNEFNKNNQIKLYAITTRKGGIDDEVESEYQTFISWIKHFFAPLQRGSSGIVNPYGILEFVYVLFTFFFASCIGFVIIKYLILKLIFNIEIL